MTIVPGLIWLALIVQSPKANDPYPAKLEAAVGSGRVLLRAPAGIRRMTLPAARKTLNSMLDRADQEVVDRLGRSGLIVIVAPRMSRFTDLPELRGLARRRNAVGQPLDRIRAIFLSPDPPERPEPVVAVGEEDILRIPPAGPKSQLRHELAHAVYFHGLDDAERELWVEIYHAARHDGLFGKTYAATDVDEFFAELTLAYFDVAPYFCSREQLRQVAPEAFAFLDRVYDPAREGPPKPWVPRLPEPDRFLKKLSGLRFERWNLLIA